VSGLQADFAYERMATCEGRELGPVQQLRQNIIFGISLLISCDIGESNLTDSKLGSKVELGQVDRVVAPVPCCEPGRKVRALPGRVLGNSQEG